MGKYLLSIVLYAVAIFFVLPLFEGITFHGNFLTAIGLGALFTVLSWGVRKAIALASGALAVGTLGVGCLIIIPLFLFGFWVIPGLVLKLLAAVAPAYLTVSTWGAALLGGLVMLVAGLPMGGSVVVRKSQTKSDN